MSLEPVCQFPPENETTAVPLECGSGLPLLPPIHAQPPKVARSTPIHIVAQGTVILPEIVFGGESGSLLPYSKEGDQPRLKSDDFTSNASATFTRSQRIARILARKDGAASRSNQAAEHHG